MVMTGNKKTPFTVARRPSFGETQTVEVALVGE